MKIILHGGLFHGNIVPHSHDEDVFIITHDNVKHTYFKSGYSNELMNLPIFHYVMKEH